MQAEERSEHKLTTSLRKVSGGERRGEGDIVPEEVMPENIHLNVKISQHWKCKGQNVGR